MVLYDKTGRYADAIRLANEILAVDPQNVKAYNNAASVYLAMKDLAAAEASYKKAIEIDRSNYYAYGNLGTIYANQGKFDEAVSLWQAALQLNPNAPGMRENLARLEALRKKVK